MTDRALEVEMFNYLDTLSDKSCMLRWGLKKKQDNIKYKNI